MFSDNTNEVAKLTEVSSCLSILLRHLHKICRILIGHCFEQKKYLQTDLLGTLQYLIITGNISLNHNKHNIGNKRICFLFLC